MQDLGIHCRTLVRTISPYEKNAIHLPEKAGMLIRFIHDEGLDKRHLVKGRICGFSGNPPEGVRVLVEEGHIKGPYILLRVEGCYHYFQDGRVYLADQCTIAVPVAGFRPGLGDRIRKYVSH